MKGSIIGFSVGALILGIGFWGRVSYIDNEEPP